VTNILGINAYHGDVSAVLVRDGQLVAAVEEERFRRIEHIAGFPKEAIRACLDMAGVKPQEIDHVAVSRNPRANLFGKAWFALRNRPSRTLVKSVDPRMIAASLPKPPNALVERTLPEVSTTQAVAGYLYFPITEANASFYELDYTGYGSWLTLPLKPQ